MEHFVYGTQYYRPPTPTPQEWERDLKAIAALGMDTIQLRVQWRWHEPAPGAYRFEDLDELFGLARKHGLRVIFKFMLETAPQYVFDRYDGVRRKFDGTPLREGSHGAYYVGGWWPCFENPGVREAATRFIETCVARYKDESNLLLWHTWNEPRSRPSQDCGCPHCLNAYRAWLREQYGTIERLNETFGVREESFETIPLPGMPHGFWDFFLYRKFMGSVVIPRRIRWVYDTIRAVDGSRPIMAHVGCSSCMQDTAHDTSDDFEVARSVDFYGTSFPVSTVLRTRKDEQFCGMIADFLRHVDRNYFVHELYPTLGRWTEPSGVEDFRFKVWTVLSRGARGLMYWQYRAERVGCETNEAGLVNMDGTATELSREAGFIGKIIDENRALFDGREVPPADAAILYDFDSALMSGVEETGRDLWDFSPRPDAANYYQTAHKGLYELLGDLSVPADYLDTRDLTSLKGYKVVFAPYLNMLNARTAAALEDFVRGGGMLIADEGFGLRQQSTWLYPNRPGDHGWALTPARWYQRQDVRGDGVKLTLPGGDVTVTPMRTVYESDEGEVLARYGDGQAAIHGFCLGRGRVVLLGTSMGYSYALHGEPGWRRWLQSLTRELHLAQNPCDDVEAGVTSRRVVCGDRSMIFVFNRAGEARTVTVPGQPERELTGRAGLQGSTLTLPAGQVACVVTRE